MKKPCSNLGHMDFFWYRRDFTIIDPVGPRGGQHPRTLRLARSGPEAGSSCAETHNGSRAGSPHEAPARAPRMSLPVSLAPWHEHSCAGPSKTYTSQLKITMQCNAMPCLLHSYPTRYEVASLYPINDDVPVRWEP